MLDAPTIPGLLTVADLARHFDISRTEALRRIANGAYPNVFRVGQAIVVTNQGLADAIARSAPVGTDARAAVDEADRLLAEQRAELAAVNAAAAENSKPAAVAARQQAAREAKGAEVAADPRTGTRQIRDRVIRFHQKGAGIEADTNISDRQVSREDIEGADPSRKNKNVGHNGRPGYTVDDVASIDPQRRILQNA